MNAIGAPMNERFAGQVVLVAGGTGGLGSAVSVAFLEEGATVAVPYRSQPEFEALRSAAIPASRLEGHAVDVTDEGAVHQLVAVIHCQARTPGRHDQCRRSYAAGQKLWETDRRSSTDAIPQLFLGYLLARSVVPAMLKQGRGQLSTSPRWRQSIMPAPRLPMSRPRRRLWP